MSSTRDGPVIDVMWHDRRRTGMMRTVDLDMPRPHAGGDPRTGLGAENGGHVDQGSAMYLIQRAGYPVQNFLFMQLYLAAH
jgi:hypothetical protein